MRPLRAIFALIFGIVWVLFLWLVCLPVGVLRAAWNDRKSAFAILRGMP